MLAWRAKSNGDGITIRALSQEPFAEEAGVHRTYVSDLERAARNPPIKVVETLAEALGVSASDLWQ